MSKKANPTSIGLFIVIGLALGVAGVILFSSGNLFSKQEKFILYFDASLKGLQPGAPVKVRGVTVGSVVDVLISHNQAEDDFAMPVIIEIDQKLMREKSDRHANVSDPATFDLAVREGLRGKLDAASLVTGVLYVDLQMVPGALPPVYHQVKKEFKEIPTAPTQIQELLANLASLDIRGISDRLNLVLDRLDTSLGELSMKQINAGITNLLTSLHQVIGSPDLTNSLALLKRTLHDADLFVRKLDGRVDPLLDDATNALQQASLTLAQLRGGVQELRDLLAPSAPLRHDLGLALDQLANASQAIATLAEFLHRNPNALITGRKPQQNKP
jgi:paraquat-inducible protein B